jgi:hypothetical protein
MVRSEFLQRCVETVQRSYELPLPGSSTDNCQSVVQQHVEPELIFRDVC